MSITAQLIAAAEPVVTEVTASQPSGSSGTPITLFVTSQLGLAALVLGALKWFDSRAEKRRADDQKRADKQREEDQAAQNKRFDQLEGKVDHLGTEVSAINLKLARDEGRAEGHEAGYDKGRRDERAAQATQAAPAPTDAARLVAPEPASAQASGPVSDATAAQPPRTAETTPTQMAARTRTQPIAARNEPATPVTTTQTSDNPEHQASAT